MDERRLAAAQGSQGKERIIGGGQRRADGRSRSEVKSRRLLVECSRIDDGVLGIARTSPRRRSSEDLFSNSGSGHAFTYVFDDPGDVVAENIRKPSRVELANGTRAHFCVKRVDSHSANTDQ